MVRTYIELGELITMIMGHSSVHILCYVKKTTTLENAPCLNTLTLYSLVPRLFLPPVFDHLQYAKMEREGLGERVTCMTSGRCDGRREGGATIVTDKLCVDQPRIYRATSCIDAVF